MECPHSCFFWNAKSGVASHLPLKWRTWSCQKAISLQLLQPSWTFTIHQSPLSAKLKSWWKYSWSRQADFFRQTIKAMLARVAGKSQPEKSKYLQKFCVGFFSSSRTNQGTPFLRNSTKKTANRQPESSLFTFLHSQNSSSPCTAISAILDP